MTTKPRQLAPELEVDIVDSGRWSLQASAPKTFTMIVAYRSLHCPICKTYLGELEANLLEFEKRGVEVIAVSVDTAERATKAKSDWGLSRLRLGYGLSIPAARAWNLYISRAQKDTEPAQFTEPGLFLVKPDGTLFTAHVSSTPWARPPLDHMLRAIDFFIENKPLARGEA